MQLLIMCQHSVLQCVAVYFTNISSHFPLQGTPPDHLSAIRRSRRWKFSKSLLATPLTKYIDSRADFWEFRKFASSQPATQIIIYNSSTSPVFRILTSSSSVCCVYIYMSMYVHIYISLCIHTVLKIWTSSSSICLCVYVPVYVYMYIYICLCI